MPRIADPGPAGYQQARAARFDPYPENDVGPPVLGGRPREYINPPPEVQRARPADLKARWMPWNTGPGCPAQ